MPYKDRERKRQWELQHRTQRLARRGQLRRIEAAHKTAQSAMPKVEERRAGMLWLPLAAGGVALASYTPKIAMGTGGLTLLLAAYHKKDWRLWIAGILILALGFFFHWSDRKEKRKELIQMYKTIQFGKAKIDI